MNGKRLYRSRKERMVAGIAGGLAEYFDIDPTLVRIIFIVTLFLGGGGFLAYIIMWIAVPEEPFVIIPPDASTGQPAAGAPVGPDPQVVYDNHRHKRRSIGGTVLIVIGVLFLLDNFFPRFDFGDFWPVILIAIGVGLLMSSKNN
jgi:phage shock protein PspC (stress-responsive transcriptional regulator)